MPSRPVRAFLSHLREEGGFVAQVARRLGQARIVTDRMAFRPGDPLPEAIRKALAESNLFVVFASAQSVSSTWVTFEMSEAEIRRIQGSMQRLLVITTDRPETRKLLPPFLGSGIVEHGPTPARAADIITQQIIALEVGTRPETLFLGREVDLSAISRRLIPAIGSPVPRALIVHGLRGVGRRTFARRALRDHLSLDAGPELVLGAAEGVDWLHLELVVRVHEFENQKALGSMLKAFEAKSDEQKGEELSVLLREVSAGGRTPVVIDDGFLMDDAGALRPSVDAMLRSLAATTDRLSLVIVTPRSPQALPQVPVAVYHLNPIDLPSTRLLLTQALRLVNVQVDPDQLGRLAPFIGGYPPAAQVAVDAVQEYGIDATLADEPALKDMTRQILAPMLDKLGLQDSEKRVLRLLAPFRELTIDVIAVQLSQDVASIAQAAKRLIDLSLVAQGEIGIALSTPLRHAVVQKFGEPTDEEFLSIAHALRSAYWQSGSPDLVPLPIIEALAVSVARAKDPTDELQNLGAYELPSALMRMAREAYDARKWERALYYAKRVMARDATREDAMTVALKVHARLGHRDEADDLLAKIGRRGLLRRFYLKGFIHMQRNEFDDAIVAFRAAIAAGDRHQMVRQQLAYCLFLSNRSPEAQGILENMPVQATSRNRYFLDLLSQILIRLRKFEEAHEVIKTMLRYGFEGDYHHRFAHLRLTQGAANEALDAADNALRISPHRNETRVLRAEALIALNRTDEATRELASIPVRTERDRDMRQEQLCRLALRNGDHQEAEARWREVRNPSHADARQLRIEMLTARLADRTLNNYVRKELERERTTLLGAETDLSDLPIDQAIDTDIFRN